MASRPETCAPTSTPTPDPTAALASLRALFPILSQQVHGHALAYLDNAATTQMPLPVLAAMQAFETTDRANVHRGVHTLSQRATDALDRARQTVKDFVGAGGEHELVFTSGATAALNLVASGLSEAMAASPFLRPGDEIVVSGLEHHANLVPWQQAARRSGATLRILRPDALGRLHVEDLVQRWSPRCRVLALTACANATGERPPYEALIAFARDQGALTVLDAAQAVAHDPALSVQGCDFMAFSGHKMHGPMGIGVLVGRREALELLSPLHYGGDMVEWVSYGSAGFAGLPQRLEGGTPHVAGAVGLAAAASFIDGVGRTSIHAHVTRLRAQAATGLSALDGLRVLSPGATDTAIVSFVADGAHPHDLGTLLDEQGIAVRTGHHCAQPLLELLSTGATTRASFALYNTAAEVDRLIAGVARALELLK